MFRSGPVPRAELFLLINLRAGKLDVLILYSGDVSALQKADSYEMQKINLPTLPEISATTVRLVPPSDYRGLIGSGSIFYAIQQRLW